MDNWEPIPGWEGVYSVSDVGRVRYEESRGRVRAGDMVAAGRDADGYAVVPLARVDGRATRRTYRVGRLVAVAFLGPAPFKGAQVNHKNGCRSDDALENLEWVSCRENIHHAIANLGRRFKGVASKNAGLMLGEVLELRERAAAGESFRALGAAFGISNVAAAKAARGLTYTDVGGPRVAAR